MQDKNACYYGPTLGPNGPPRPLQWSENSYNEYLDRAVTLGLAHEQNFSVIDARLRVGLIGTDMRQSYTPYVTIQDSMKLG